jgi:flagella basal body P-ring formation protein FlgA
MRSSSRPAARLRAAGTALLALVAAAAASGGRLTVARQVTVEGPTVRLGDIAVLEGEATEALAMLPIAPAPPAGEDRQLDGRLVLQALGRQGVDLDAIVYSVPRSILVRRALQEIDPGAVREVLERFLAETVAAGGGDSVLHAVEVPGPIRIPAGSWAARVIPPAGVELLGRVRLQVEFTVDDRPVKTVWVTADIGLYAPVVVLRRALGRGEVLAAADLTTDRRDLSQMPRGVVARVEEAAGMVAKAPLLPYAPIRRDQLEPPAAVRRGDVVLLVAERGLLRITAAGEVREDAGLGQQVRVVNRATRKDLVGRVLDPSTVAVEF